MSTLDPDMGALVADAIRGLGIELHLGVAVEAFDTSADGRVTAVRTPTASSRPTWSCSDSVCGPASQLAAEAGHRRGRDRRDRRPTPAWRRAAKASGRPATASRSFHRVSRRPAAIALGTHANKQGRVVGCERDGGSLTFPGVVGTAVTKLCEHEVARTGLTEREARDAGFRYRRGGHRVDDPRRLLPRERRRSRSRSSPRRDRPVARRAGDRPRGRGEAHRRARGRDLERDDRRPSSPARPRVRAAVLARFGIRRSSPPGRWPRSRADLRARRSLPALGLRRHARRRTLALDVPPERPGWRDCYRVAHGGEFGRRWNCGPARFDELATEMSTRLGMSTAAVRRATRRRCCCEIRFYEHAWRPHAPTLLPQALVDGEPSRVPRPGSMPNYPARGALSTPSSSRPRTACESKAELCDAAVKSARLCRTGRQALLHRQHRRQRRRSGDRARGCRLLVPGRRAVPASHLRPAAGTPSPQ